MGLAYLSSSCTMLKEVPYFDMSFMLIYIDTIVCIGNVTVELKDGHVYRGVLEEAQDSMNCTMKVLHFTSLCLTSLYPLHFASIYLLNFPAFHFTLPTLLHFISYFTSLYFTLLYFASLTSLYIILPTP